MLHPQFPSRLALTCVLLALTSFPALAQEAGSIKWRTDYNAARKESETKNLPVFIDFVRPACAPCERMEQITFRDARIVKVLNDKFIPLKINGFEEATLASRLGVSAYPTLVLAAPDGRIVKNMIGFQEADSLNDQLLTLLASITPPDAFQKDYDNALKWEAAGDFARAISAARTILDSGKAPTMQKNAQELIAKIEKRADDRLAQARDLNAKGKSLESLEALVEIQRTFAGLQASREAADLIAQVSKANEGAKVALRAKRVRELLTQAQDFYKTKDYIPCLDRCEVIIANYGDLPEGQQAFALASEIKNNPEWLQNAADVMTDRLGGLYLALADSYLKRGEVQRAQFYLQRVVQAFPGSSVAESAQIRLTQLRGTSPGAKTVESARP